jgi:hypothetical protein
MTFLSLGPAAEERDELASPHSTTSSAVASSAGGIERPSALAVEEIISTIPIWFVTGLIWA